MPAIAVNPPFPLFTDADGQPLDDAYIYIGTANQNPVSNPIAVYWDSALTIAASQPIRTSGGYPVYNGSPARFYTNSDYSILVRDKNGAFVYTAAGETDFISSEFVTFIQSGVGAVQRSAQDKLREFVSVKDFGAKGDGTTNDTAAIQAAINAVIAAGGGAVYIPAATYITRELTIAGNNITIFGDGSVSLLKRDGSWTGTNRGIFQFDNSTQDLENITIRTIGIDFNGTLDFGFGIKLGNAASLPATYNYSRNVRITDVRFRDSNPQATTGDKWGVVFRGKLENVWIERCHSSNDMQLCAGGVDIHKNINILNNVCYEGRANGIAMSTPYNVESLSIIGNYVEANSLGIYVGPDQIYGAITSGTWRDVVIANNRIITKSAGSTSTWMGIYVNAAGTGYKNVAISGNAIECKDTLNSQHGIRFTDQTGYSTVIDNAAITGNVIENCRYGISIDAGGKSQISGNQVTNCTDGIYLGKVSRQCGVVGNNCFGGTRAINVVEGEVLVSGNTCQGGTGQTGSFAGRLTVSPGTGKTAKVLAIGNKFTDGLGGAGTNIYGVRCPGTGTMEVQLYDNDLRGNTAGVDNLPATARVQNNLGFVTNNGGQTAAIATGTTVTHGCSSTPTIVLATPLSSGPTNVTVSAVGSTTFTINFGGGGSYAFAWEAKTTYFYQ